LVADKLLSIAALLAAFNLPTGVNPVRHIYVCLVRRDYIAWEDVEQEEMTFWTLSDDDTVLLLNFATSLVEQLSKLTLSKQDQYKYIYPVLI
jgi:hypothetical protein